MIWTYTETHTRTLRHRHAHTHAYCIHTDMHTIATRALELGAACLQYASHPRAVIHTSIQTHCTNRCACQCPHTPSWSLSLSLSLTHSHTHSLAVIHYYMSILWTSLHWTSPYTFSSGRFGRQTMRNDSKWKCTTCSPIRPLSSKPNICVFLSLCLHQACS